MNTCESCDKEFPEGEYVVACVPGVPYSACYCRSCIQKNSHPMWVLIATVAAIGGLHNAHDEVRQMVADSLHAQGRSPEWFATKVEEAIVNLEKYAPTPAPPTSDAF